MGCVSRISIALFVAAIVAGCANLNQAPDTLVGNNTGGVIPPKMAATQNVDSLAAAHCAKWNLTARITFPASQTGGEAVFVCEQPGQKSAVPVNPEPPMQTKSQPKKKSN